METFKSILVDIDVSTPAHPALDRAVRLARKCGAKLTIADVMAIPPYTRRYFPAELEETMVSQQRQQLARLAHGVAGVQTDSKLLMGRPATVLIQEILRSNHDLLVRSHARDLVGPKPFGAIDMELLRKCPCPVFLAGPGSTEQHPRALGAVNASTEEAAEQALNVKIVELTLLLAQLEGSSPILLQAWTPFAERIVRNHCSNAEFAKYVDDARQQAETDLSTLRHSFGKRLESTQTILRRGEPEDVIPEFVVEQGIDVVVMGTVARTGISGLLIGNTAERVLRKLPCSVLAVKPDGFVSPIRL
jgi:nucleotide-binding universal stress UspA family protein